MPDDEDWRLRNQETYLAGVTLTLRRWSTEHEGWDHDHCSFCWAKIWDPAGGEDEVDVAYATKDGAHWVCPACVADFTDRFGWTIES